MAKAGRGSDQFMVRLPEGMRERIKRAAERNGRSMNAEVVATLEHTYPPEPSMEELISRVHHAIEMAERPHTLPYKKVLIEALSDFEERLSSGIDFEQTTGRWWTPEDARFAGAFDRIQRWKRVQKHGIEQSDLEREIEKGLLRQINRDYVEAAIKAFESGNDKRGFEFIRLGHLKFVDPEAAKTAILNDLKKYYEENWGGEDDEEDFDFPDE